MAQNLTNKSRLLEKYVQVVREDGLNTNKNVNIGVNGTTANLWVSGTTSFGGTATFTVASASGHATTAAINSTTTATAAQVATGYITSTSGSATTITLPTGTLLGAQLGATQGTVFRLYVDNTAGANTVTMAVAVNGIVSSAGVSSATTFGLLTITAGVTGIAEFTIMFSSATAYVFSRTA